MKTPMTESPRSYEFSMSKTLTVGSAQDFIMRFTPPIHVRAGSIATSIPANIITVFECFMGGQDMRVPLKIHGFGVDAVKMNLDFRGPPLGPSAGVSIKCWYNGDEPEGYRTGERLVLLFRFTGSRGGEA